MTVAKPEKSHWTPEGRERFNQAVRALGDLIARSRPDEVGLQALRVEGMKPEVTSETKKG